VKTVVLTPSGLDLPAGWSGDAFRDAVQRAAERWSAPNVPCAVKLTVAEPRPVRLAARDGSNVVVMRGRSWCHNDRCGPETTFPQRAAGMTTVYPQGATGVAIEEADVELNAAAFQRPGALESVLVHEIGHVLGLGDACVAGHRASGRPVIAECSADERARAMFPSGLKATVGAADVAELCRLYPPEPAAVSTAAAYASGGALVTMALVGVWLARRRRTWRARAAFTTSSGSGTR
jgi:hypothetical protein